MTEGQISVALGPILKERGLVLVSTAINKFDEITLTIDAPGRSVSMDDCVAVNRRFTELFDQDVEDYALTVTSPGVENPDLSELENTEQ